MTTLNELQDYIEHMKLEMREQDERISTFFTLLEALPPDARLSFDTDALPEVKPIRRPERPANITQPFLRA